MKMYLPSSFILRYVRAEMNVHALMNELDQKDYWYPRKIEIFENLCTKSMERCPLVISHILAECHPEMATYTTLHNHFSFGLSKSAQTFTVGFVKLPSTHSIHIVVWGNFPFNITNEHDERETRNPFRQGSRARVFYALSCYLSLIFKHSDTKWDLRNHSLSILRGRPPVAPPLDPPLQI